MSIDVHKCTTISELRARIPNIGQRRLMFQNRYLYDGTIMSNGIGKNATVYVDSRVSRCENASFNSGTCLPFGLQVSEIQHRDQSTLWASGTRKSQQPERSGKHATA